jgi:excisionase family DNA binding protein
MSLHERIDPSRAPADPAIEAALEALRLAAAALERAAPAPPPDDGLPRWLRAREVADALGLSVKHTYDLMARGVLPTVRINHAVRVPEDALRAYMDRLRAEQAAPTGLDRPAAPADAQRWGRGDRPSQARRTAAGR